SRERGDRCVTRSAGLCLRGEPDGRAGATNCYCTPARGVGRHLGRTSAIAGIYGMNFEHMPELKWAYGYFLVIGVIVAICATLYAHSRPPGWLWLAAPAGRRPVKPELLPGPLVTVTPPPIRRASLREMARPSPVPP